MIRLYLAELLKLRTLRGTWGFVIVALGSEHFLSLKMPVWVLF